MVSLLFFLGSFGRKDRWRRISLLVYDFSLGWLLRHSLATLERTGC